MIETQPETWEPADGPSEELVSMWVIAQRAGEIAFQLGEIARAELIHKAVMLETRIYEA